MGREEALVGYPVAVRQAWQDSILHGVGARATDALTDGAREQHFYAGQVITSERDGARSAPLCLVVDGLMRVYMQSTNGREVTVRYASHGDLVGLPAAIGNCLDPTQPAYVQAVTPAHVLTLSARRMAALAASDLTVAWPVARYLADEVHQTDQFWASNMFQPLRARVARHLLDLAVRQNGVLVVQASQQDLAYAIGSVREVVARALRELTDEGLVTRTPEGIAIKLPAELHRVSAMA